MFVQRFTLVAYAAIVAAASLNGNINYGSPSLRHASLGINMRKIRRRVPQKRDGTYHHATDVNFTHGVASGDPFADSVILWTRASPVLENDASNVTVEGTVPYFSHETERYINASKSPVCVDWMVSLDPKLGNHVASLGRAYTTSDIDYNIKIEAGGLAPFTTYYYQFTVCDTSITLPVGRTKTAPAPDDDLSSLSLGVFSCANYPLGYFNAYGNIVRKDSVDYVLHLGDYIYEDEVGVPGEERAGNWVREALEIMVPYVRVWRGEWPDTEERGEMLRRILVENPLLFARWKLSPVLKQFAFDDAKVNCLGCHTAYR